jgi:hypothetical protein
VMADSSGQGEEGLLGDGGGQALNENVCLCLLVGGLYGVRGDSYCWLRQIAVCWPFGHWWSAGGAAVWGSVVLAVG